MSSKHRGKLTVNWEFYAQLKYHSRVMAECNNFWTNGNWKKLKLRCSRGNKPFKYNFSVIRVKKYHLWEHQILANLWRIGGLLYTAAGVEIGTMSLDSNLILSRRVRDKHFQSGQAFAHMLEDPKIQILSIVLLAIVKNWKQYVF